jgi:hypothetical protein
VALPGMLEGIRPQSGFLRHLRECDWADSPAGVEAAREIGPAGPGQNVVRTELSERAGGLEVGIALRMWARSR